MNDFRLNHKHALSQTTNSRLHDDGPEAVAYIFQITFQKIFFKRNHTHPFNGPLSGTTQVSRYQKGKTNLDFTEARDSERQWHQLGRVQVCTLLQTDNHQQPTTQFFTGRMPFLPPNQQRQSTVSSINAEINVSCSVGSVFKTPGSLFSLPWQCWHRNVSCGLQPLYY